MWRRSSCTAAGTIEGATCPPSAALTACSCSPKSAQAVAAMNLLAVESGRTMAIGVFTACIRPALSLEMPLDGQKLGSRETGRSVDVEQAAIGIERRGLGEVVESVGQIRDFE